MSFENTVYNVNPYYDDFDATKKFLRVLFRPGYSVQARELTQIQTILHNQINTFGNHIFENGSLVTGGQISESAIQYARIVPTTIKISTDGGTTYTAATTAQITTAFSDAVGSEFGIGDDSYADGIGRIISTLRQNDDTTDTYEYIFFDYLTGSSSVTNNSTIEFETDSGVRYRFKVKASNLDQLPVTGAARIVTTQAGIYFVDGSFVITEAQETVPYTLATSSNNTDGSNTVVIGGKMFEEPTARIGFTVTDTIVTSDDDESLLDPANGFPNFTAPGADRLKKTLVLGFSDYIESTVLATSGFVSNGFVEILRYENGVATKREIFPDYSVIEETLARRTHDESGNYTVSDFNIQIREHLADGDNEGIYTVSNGGDESKLAVVLEPGSAYILGNKFETIARTFVDVDKARTYDSEDDKFVDVNIGSYVIIGGTVGMLQGFSNGVGYLDSQNHPVVQLADSGGSTFGTALFRQIDIENASRNEYRMYLYDINLNSGGDFANTASLFASTGDTIATISITSGIDGSGNTIQYSPTKDSLVIPLPVNSSIRGVDNIDFDVQLSFEAAAASGEINVSTSPVPVIFPGDTDDVISNSHLNNKYFLVNATDNSFISDYSGITFTTSSGNTGLKVEGLTNGETYRVLANCEVNTSDVNFANVMRTKTLGASETISGVTLGSDLFTGITYGNIGVADIYTLEAVIGATDNPGTDLTSRFVLDDGQRDNLYDHGRILLAAGATPGDSEFDITVRRFTHAGGDGPIVADSYPVGTAYSGSTFGYENIPSFTSNKTGVVKSLRDVIDFRPIKADDGTVSDAWIPVAKETMAASFSYYLPRIDRITLSKDREFKVISGIPSLDPQAPDVDQDSMTLYSLRLGAYTFDTSDVETQHHETRRFTMKDIGQLEKRVDDLEYFSSLSLLEQDANSRTFVTGSNAVIPKVGIVVDNFNGHEIGDVNNQDYNCSMDFVTGTLRPAFKAENVSLVENTDISLVNMVKSNGIYTLDYTSVPDITYPLADNSNVVNPTDRIDWYGDMNLSPNSDDWYGDEKRAGVRSNKYGVNDAWEYRTNRTESPYGFGTQWRDWEYNWFGIPKSDFEIGPQDLNNSNRVFDKTFEGSEDATRNRFFEFLSSNQIQSSSISTDARKNIAKNSTPDSIFKTTGNRKHNTSIQPYNRANTVVCNVYGMKPSTTYYKFVDNVSYGTGTTDAKGQALNVSIPLVAGDVRSGDVLIRFIDDENNNIENATTVAESVYRVGGLASTQDSDIISTRPHKTKRSSVASTNILSSTLNRNLTDGSSVNDLDAMAQNFTVDKNKYAKGMFANSIDLMFSSIPGTNDKDVPVTIEIRPTVSGYPHPSKIIPGTIVSKYKADVTVASDTDFTNSSNRTTFEFDYPVYLKPGQYSIIIRSNSKKYLVYSGVIGNSITSLERITQQPFVGKFFKAQNAGTYAADNTQKLTFALNRCKFDTTSGSASFRNLSNDISEDFTYDSYYIHSGHMDFGRVGIAKQLSFQIQTTQNGGSLESSARDIAVNQTVTPIQSSGTQIVKESDKSVVLTATMNTDDDAISPVIDAQRLSFLAIQNNVNTSSSTTSNTSDPQYNGEIDPIILDSVSSSIVSKSRYITKSVTLADGVAATDLRVIMDINQQSGTNIQVFVKALSDTDTVGLDGKDYIELEPQTVVISETDSDFSEVEYAVSDSTVFGSFDVFVVKIVMHSSDQFVVPKAQDMRVIALA